MSDSLLWRSMVCIWTALLLSGCASIHVDNDKPRTMLSTSVTIAAQGRDSLFSRFTSPLRVREATIWRAASIDPAPVSVVQQPGGIDATFTSPKLPFDVSDLLFVTWEGNTVDLLGNTGQESLLTITGFAAPKLCIVVDPPALGPGMGGVAEPSFTLPVAVPTTIQLDSKAFVLSMNSVAVAAGQTTPPAPPTTVPAGFFCPDKPIGAGISTQCSEKNGVLATATYGTRTLQACMQVVNLCPCPVGKTCYGAGPGTRKPPTACSQ